MALSKILAGDNAPDEINVIIEIPAHSDPVKYEVDKETGAIMVDRFMSTPMFYPALMVTYPVLFLKTETPLTC